MTRVFLLGDPVAHSISPAIHNAAFRALGFRWRYQAIRVPSSRLAGVVSGLRADPSWRGANVTVPHKTAVMAVLDSLSRTSRAIGSVNTIVVRAGKLRGENTDAAGFLDDLRRWGSVLHPPLRIRGTVVVLGAGGAARAIAWALALAGARDLVIVNRTRARAHRLSEDIRRAFPSCRVRLAGMKGRGVRACLGRADLVVNATSVGMRPGDQSPISVKWLARGARVYDLVYNRETALVKAARERGLAARGGMGMLIAQGARSFQFWTGRKAPVEVMRRAAHRTLSS